jgi:2-dehydro-3-deoxy-D-arabinonate dehydratase
MPDHLFLVNQKNQLGLQVGDTLYNIDKSRLPFPLGIVLQRFAASELTQVLLDARGDVWPDTLPRLELDDQEVWAAGVTYKRSEEARERESNQSNMYSRVYSAERPELFFKSLGRDVVSSGQSVGIRYDAAWSVPEPELVVVLNARMEVVGFTIGNDMSSRDIEGANPLYLPQAKVYEASCAIGPRIWLQPGATTWPELTIQIAIRRGGQTVFEDRTSTANLHRTLADLVSYLGRCKRFPYGALLFTGTGIVPPDTFTLQAGDEVSINIDPIGELVNPVIVVGQPD